MMLAHSCVWAGAHRPCTCEFVALESFLRLTAHGHQERHAVGYRQMTLSIFSIVADPRNHRRGRLAAGSITSQSVGSSICHVKKMVGYDVIMMPTLLIPSRHASFQAPRTIQVGPLNDVEPETHALEQRCDLNISSPAYNSTHRMADLI